MGLVRTVKRSLGFGRSDEQIREDLADELDEMYPDLPREHFCCEDCSESFSMDYIGNFGFKNGPDGEPMVVYFCADCARWDRVGGDPRPHA